MIALTKQNIRPCGLNRLALSGHSSFRGLPENLTTPNASSAVEACCLTDRQDRALTKSTQLPVLGDRFDRLCWISPAPFTRQRRGKNHRQAIAIPTDHKLAGRYFMANPALSADSIIRVAQLDSINASVAIATTTVLRLIR